MWPSQVEPPDEDGPLVGSSVHGDDGVEVHVADEVAVELLSGNDDGTA